MGQFTKGGAVDRRKRFVINVPLDGLLSDTRTPVSSEGWPNVRNSRQRTTLAVRRAIYFTSCKNTRPDHVSNTERGDREREREKESDNGIYVVTLVP